MAWKCRNPTRESLWLLFVLIAPDDFFFPQEINVEGERTSRGDGNLVSIEYVQNHFQVPLITNYLSDSTFFIVGMQLSGRVYYPRPSFHVI